jgi:hypothetical protein
MAIRVIFFQFSMGDVEDPEIYCASPIWDWLQTDYGIWCKEHSQEPIAYTINIDVNIYGYKCTVYGSLTEEDFTFHQLKWSDRVNFNC